MYRIRGADKKEYGPVSSEKLRQWIIERRANGQSLIQKEGTSDWGPLATFPEFSEALRTGANAPGGPQIPRTLTGSIPSRSSGLAISSVVLGILGVFTCGLSSLVGFMLGIVALIKIKQSNGRLSGNGLAIAGICVSGLFTLLGAFVGVSVLAPAISHGKSNALIINCQNNLREIGLAARMWSNDHDDTFPPNLLSLSNELSSPKVLTCLGDTSRAPAETWAQFDARNITYEYLTPGVKDDSALMRKIILRCPIHGTVCHGDGSVK